MAEPIDVVPDPVSKMYQRIIVGVDGSENSLGALRHAANLGARLGIDVLAVRAWGPRPAYAGTDLGPSDLRDEASFGVEEAITRAFANQPPERVSGVAREGDPADVLMTESGPSDLLVVGSRGHGGIAGIVLGSTSARCAEHASCPVLVYHDRPLAAAG